MDERAGLEQGFIEHVVKWALTLPVDVRRQLVTDAHAQAQASREATRAAPGSLFADAAVWAEIARRIQEEGHTPLLAP